MTTAILPEVSTWQLDASHSSIGFSVKHLMIATVKGSFGKYEASFSGDEVQVFFRRGIRGELGKLGF